MKLKCRPVPVDVTGPTPSLNPSVMALSIDPVMACPEFCPTTLVAASCNARSKALSPLLGTEAGVTVTAAELLVLLLPSPP